MTPVKRIEIVIDRIFVDQVLSALDRAGGTGYTLLRNATGKGDRGERLGDELTDVFSNCCVIAAVPVEHAPRLVEAIRPILREVGGMCLVSDAQWLLH